MTDQRRTEIMHASAVALVAKPELYHETVELMEQVNALMAGRPPSVVIQALQHLLTAALEIVSERMDSGRAIDTRDRVN